jgi:hypothetical protein
MSSIASVEKLLQLLFMEVSSMHDLCINEYYDLSANNNQE